MEKVKWGSEQWLRDSSWDGTNLSFEKDRAYGLSWPQRNYRCSFCEKEFKSAQALGGHMNVHRRDRARTRLSPSWDSPNSNPDPNPNLNPCFSLSSSTHSSSSSFVAKLSPYSTSAFHSSLANAVPNSAPSSASLHQEKVQPAFYHLLGDDNMSHFRGDREKKNRGAMLEFAGLTRRKDARVWKAKEFVGLDLNLGLLEDAKEDVDLELRLGYS